MRAVDDEYLRHHVERKAEQPQVLDPLDLVLAVADEALVEGRRALLWHHQVGLVPGNLGLAGRLEIGNLGLGMGNRAWA